MVGKIALAMLVAALIAAFSGAYSFRKKAGTLTLSKRLRRILAVDAGVAAVFAHPSERAGGDE